MSCWYVIVVNTVTQNATDVSFLKEILEALQTGGPWTVVIALGYVVRVLYVRNEQRTAEHAEEKQKLNDRIIAMAEKQNETFEKVTQNQTLLLEAVNAPRQLPPAR